MIARTLRVVLAHHREPVERQVAQELDEGRLEPLEVLAVRLHVVGVDVGHHRDHRLEVEERRVGLVGLGHQELALAQARVGADGVEPPADHAGGIEPRLAQHGGHQRGGGGLAVGAGDGDALLEAHELRQHHRARHHRNARLARAQHLGVVGLHRGRDDDGIRALDVLRRVADHDADAQPRAAGAPPRSPRGPSRSPCSPGSRAPRRCPTCPSRRCRRSGCASPYAARASSCAGIGAGARGVAASRGRAPCAPCRPADSDEATQQLGELRRLRLELPQRDARAAIGEERARWPSARRPRTTAAGRGSPPRPPRRSRPR